MMRRAGYVGMTNKPKGNLIALSSSPLLCAAASLFILVAFSLLQKITCCTVMDTLQGAFALSCAAALLFVPVAFSLHIPQCIASTPGTHTSVCL